MEASQIELFQRVRITCDQANSGAQQGWTGTVMDYQAGNDHAQIEIDPRFASQTFLGIPLQDLAQLSPESPGV